MKFNINDKIKVKLTSLGKRVYLEYIEECNKRLPEKCPKMLTAPCDNQGYNTFQLWEFMYIFGGYFRIGLDLPIETDIILED